MPKPFDATLKELIEAFPTDWLVGLGVPIDGPVEVLSPELSTVTAATDALIRVGNLVVHIDAESGLDPGLGSRLLLYNVLAHRATGLPVHSVAVLLRPKANAGRLADELAYAPRPAGGLKFRFEVVRVWERPASEWLAAGVGLNPLASLGRLPPGHTRREMLPGVLQQVAEKIVHDAPAEWVNRLLASAIILGGMYLDDDQLQEAIGRFPPMIESSAFTLFERLVGAKLSREMILKQGTYKFGKPTREQEQKLAAIDDVVRLERLQLRLLKVDSWDALLRGR